MGSPAVRWSDSARERCRNNADGFGNGFAGIAVICVVLRKAVVQMAPRNISQGYWRSRHDGAVRRPTSTNAM